MARRFILALAAIAMSCVAFGSYAAEPQHKQQVSGYVVPAAPVTGEVPGTTVIYLAIGLPLKDAAGLRALAEAVSDPKSGQFRKFLTLEQLTERFGPTAADYQALIAWAQANKLTVETQYRHRLLLGVTGAAADVEQALAVQLGYATRPDGTTFYRPDRAPSLDLDVQILYIAGVDNLFVPRHHGGSQGIGGVSTYASPDLRNAYAATCLGLTGAGQSVGLMAFGGYNHQDIQGYETTVGIANASPCGASVPGSAPCLNDAFQPGFSGPINGYTTETTADVELAIAMAPGLQQVEVFEGDPTLGCVSGDSIVSSMLTATDVKQFSSSVGFCPLDNIHAFDMMAAAGQSFFSSSGDNGTGTTGNDLNFNAYQQSEVTDVGGTNLSMKGKGVSYQSEQAWQFSGGGVENLPSASCPANCTPGNPGCPGNCIPSWQQGVANAQNGASSTYRNDPDLAMPAQNLFQYLNGFGGNQMFCGTSASSPLMAGFMALVNQQQCINAPASCANNTGGIGFVNPTLYKIGMNAAIYGKSFHKVIGNATNVCGTDTGQSASAVSGYNLATGWESPTCGLVDQLSCTTCTGNAAAPGKPPSSSCVSFQSDSNNCGSCGNVCSAGNVCVSGRCQTGSSVGDTHLTTFDGLLYDFQASGDFLLVESDKGFVVQTRQASGAPRWPKASVNKAVATQMDKTRVALCLDPTRLVINGKPNDLGDHKSLSLPSGVSVSRSGNVYVITRRSGETVSAELKNGWIDVSVGLGHAPQATVRGLLGNANGTIGDDIATRDGTVLKQPVSFADLYHRYADSWRVAAADSLVCADPKVEPGVPETPFYANDLDPAEYARVRVICTAAGVKGQSLLDACTLDLEVLGDETATRVFARAPAPTAVARTDSR